MGGTVTAPTYEDVCTGKTGHSEVAMIAYDPGCISFRELLGIFFKSHDPCKRQQGEYTEEPVRTGNLLSYMTRIRSWQRSISVNYDKEGVVRRRNHPVIAPPQHFIKADECHQQFYEKMGRCYPVLNTRDPGEF